MKRNVSLWIAYLCKKTLTECLHFSVLSSQIKRQPTEVENKERLEWWRLSDIYSSHLLFIVINLLFIMRLRSGDSCTEMGKELKVLNFSVNLSFLSLSSPLLTKCFCLQLSLICFPCPHHINITTGMILLNHSSWHILTWPYQISVAEINLYLEYFLKKTSVSTII